MAKPRRWSCSAAAPICLGCDASAPASDIASLRDGRRWVIYEPLLHRTVISIAEPAEGFDLAGWFELFGHAVVPARVAAVPPKPAPWGPFTCVEAVKRVLGIRRRRIVTPWQLYRYLWNRK